MPGIDETLFFRPLNVSILTISDMRNFEIDKSGECLANKVRGAGHILNARSLAKDEISDISNQVRVWAEDREIDVVLTTGGETTIEAIKPMFEKVLDGFSILYHQRHFDGFNAMTLKSRVSAGLINETFVFCLPGSGGAAEQIWEDILQFALDSRYRPSSLVDLMPRLKE